MVGSIGNSGSYYVRQAHFDNDRMAGSVAHWKTNIGTDNTSVDALSMVDGDTKSSNVTAPTASFGELLDVVNPLHHLPIVGNIYRNMTGDRISPVAQIIGGTIYGGGLGALSAIANAAVQEHSGKDNLGSAVISEAKSDKGHYELIEDERSAGMDRVFEKPEVIAKATETIEVASLIAPQSKTSKNQDIFEQMGHEKREPVTRVSIEVAVAKVIKNDWGNLNA